MLFPRSKVFYDPPVASMQSKIADYEARQLRPLAALEAAAEDRFNSREDIYGLGL